MNGNVFIDTNILLYAHDTHEGIRHDAAQEIVLRLWKEDEYPVISIQVLQELHVNLLRKRFTTDESGAIIRDFAQWNVIPNTLALLFSALDIQKRFKLSFWDASIVAAALQADCRELWTEDLQEGQRFGGLVVRNPLKASR